MAKISQFHLAFPVTDLDEARAFYGGVIGCPEGRCSDVYVDFDFYGHQIVAHITRDAQPRSASRFDGHDVPVPHFGLNLGRAEWGELAARLRRSRCRFREYPHARMVGQPFEHDTLFVYDPSGNALEFKSFRDPALVFATDGRHDVTAPSPDSEQVLRPRLEAALHRTRGAVQDGLLAGGFLDSIGAMELVAAIQDDLGVVLGEIELSELATVTTLTAAVAAAVRRSRA